MMALYELNKELPRIKRIHGIKKDCQVRKGKILEKYFGGVNTAQELNTYNFKKLGIILNKNDRFRK